MLTLGCVLSSTATLGACSIGRPDGAYDASYYDPDNDEGFNKDPGVDADVPDDTEPVADAGGDPDDLGDSSGDPPDDGPLSVLEGRYLVRMDNYSTASVSKDGATLRVNNRISNLYVVSLNVVDGQLVGHETLCTQSYWNFCQQGCTSSDAWKVTLDSRVPARLAKLVVDRNYNVDLDGNLVAEESSIALGFTPTDGQPTSPATALPADKTDPSVWRLGASTDAKNVGLRARIDATLAGPLNTPIGLQCTLAGVQVFTTSFSGKLDLGASSPLAGKSFRLDTSAATGHAVDVFGESAYCTADNLDGTVPSDQVSVISFKSYGTKVNCPADFESEFPGSSTPLL